MPPLVSPLRSRENRLELEEESLFKMEEELKWGDGKIPEAKGVKLDKIFESEERKNCSWSSNLTSFCTPAASRSKARLHHPLSLSNSRLLIAFSFALPSLWVGVYTCSVKSQSLEERKLMKLHRNSIRLILFTFANEWILNRNNSFRDTIKMRYDNTVSSLFLEELFFTII